MKFKEKLIIFVIAVVVSVLGFTLIASSTVCLLTAAKEAGYESIEKCLARRFTNIDQAQGINSSMKLSQLALLDEEEKNGR